MRPYREVMPTSESLAATEGNGQQEANQEKSPDSRPQPNVSNSHQANAVFTIDVEDWYHGIRLERVVQNADQRLRYGLSLLLDILDEFDVRATLFWLGDAIHAAPDLLLRAAQSGHEIALHHLHHRLVYQQTPGEFRADVVYARAMLEDYSGKSVCGFRAPYFSITNRSLWALSILAEHGFTYDASILPSLHYRSGIPGSPPHPYRIRTSCGTLWELPVSTVRRFGVMIPTGGGAYFRLYPQWLLAANFAKFQRSGYLPVFYLHPWELDALQPREKLPRIEWLTHYFGLHSTEKRLRSFMANHIFCTAESYLTKLSQEKKL